MLRRSCKVDKGLRARCLFHLRAMQFAALVAGEGVGVRGGGLQQKAVYKADVLCQNGSQMTDCGHVRV